MKNIMLMSVFATIHMLASNVFAQTASDEADGYKDVTIQVPKDVTVEVIGDGPDEVIEVPYVVQRIHEVDPAPTNVTNKYVTNNIVQGSSSFLVRSGVGVRTFQGSPARSFAQMVGLVGEVGYSDLPWRLQGRFDVGRCQKDNIAIGGSLALMYLLGDSHVSVGLGADLLYCTDTDDPKEVNKKRFVGGSARVGYEIGDHLLLEGYLGSAQETTPVVGGLDSRVGLNGGVGVSILF